MSANGEAAQQIRDVIQQWKAAAARKDVSAIEQLYAEDARVMMPHAPVAEGRNEAGKIWQAMLSLPNVALDWEPALIESAASADLAYVVGTYSLDFDAGSGRKKDRGKYVAVWKKIDGSWKLAVDSANSDLPAT